MYSPPPRPRSRSRSVSPKSDPRYPHDYPEDHQHDPHDLSLDHRKDHSSNRHRHRDGHHKNRSSKGPFSMDLLRTAISTLGDAVMNGIDDGQHHQRQRSDDYDQKTLNPWGNKTADQVYETLVQAAYTLGEVVGDLERKFGVNQGKERESRSKRRSRHKDVEDGHNRDYPNGYDRDYPNGYDRDYPNGYDRDYPNGGYNDYYGYPNDYPANGVPVPQPPADYGWGQTIPPDDHVDEYAPGGGDADEYYNSSQRRPHPPRRASSNPEFQSSHRQWDDESDDHRSSRSSKTSKSKKSSQSSKNNKQVKGYKRTGSPSFINDENATRKKREAILHRLPGLLTRAAFILEIRELKNKHQDSTGIAAKYGMMLMALKIIGQLGEEYVSYCERTGKGKK